MMKTSAQNQFECINANMVNAELMSGHWADTTSYTFGGTGYGGATPTKYIFPGDPNDTSQWSEISESNLLPPGGRYMFGGIGPMSFGAGEVKHFDFAFTTSYDSTATMYSIVDTLKRDVDIVQGFYNHVVAPCRNRLDLLLAIQPVSGEDLRVSVFPNPANNLVTVEAGENIQSLQMADITGRLVMQRSYNSARVTIDVSSLAKGVYVLDIKSGGKFAVKKLVIE